MSRCTIDHTLEDVRKKLEEQQSFLPQELFGKCQRFLDDSLDQTTLNDIFHLLKKYDLASEEVREERNASLRQIV
ncbi:group-specific protein [Sporosarcina obsidiansis]|uniref:group-specific protein n=1 Tax=Sporosarcina obsidiansis TaxID=2660748 RepID=UPI00129AD9BB|nr:group-specific protein [Sporosarcina obsidiansis]